MTQQELKQVLVNYCDFRGIQRAKVIPAYAKETAARDGVGFAGFASWLDLIPADSDVIAIPDFESEFVLPWRRNVSWVPSDLFMDGEPLSQCPRGLLKKVLGLFSDQGMTVKTGVEAEFFLLKRGVGAGVELFDGSDDAEKPCYSQSVLWSHLDFIAEVMDSLNSLGWGCYQADHEDANGQFEINWGYDVALKTADKHSFFKLAVKSIAEKYGALATFMPKPFNELTGNGCHTHLSVWDGSKNLFNPSRSELNATGLSDLGESFVAGILKHARSLSCFLNPSVNSYKRLYCSRTRSGSSWASNHVSFGGNDRSVMIRVPEPGRFELRQPDGSVNPYLAQAAICAAGWIGLRDKMDIRGVIAELDDRKISSLPNSLEEAICDLVKDDELTNVLGQEFVGKYIGLKSLEVVESRSRVTSWEIESYLDV